MSQTSPELDTLLAEKQTQLKSAKQPEIVSGALRTAFGAASGYAVGALSALAAFVTVSFKGVKTYIEKNKAQLERFEREYAHTTPPPEVMEKMGQDVLKEIERATKKNEFASVVMHNPKAWMGGVAMLGGVIGFVSHLKQRQQKIDAVQHDVDLIARAQKSWTERHALAENKQEKAASPTI